ncbi:hypothetical protein BH24ACT7_BH24ACT7_16090 [soil metagenome]
MFPKEIVRVSRRWAATRYTNIRWWNELRRGGYFPALEDPQTSVEDVRSVFRLIRQN